MQQRFTNLLFLSFSLCYLGLGTLSAQVITETYEYDGLDRNYILFLPDDIAPGAPLVFNLHGYGSNATEQLLYSGMNNVAEANGFAVVYPTGSMDNNGFRHWRSGIEISNTDDVGFLTELAGFLQTTYDLDPERTFSCGMSNGGFMSYHLACQAPETFKAIASVTGTMSSGTFNDCAPSVPVPVLEIHGTADEVVPYEGRGDIGDGWGSFIATETVIDFWADLNECSEFEEADLEDLDPTDGSTVMSKKYTDCATGNRVWLYTVENGGHDWPGAFFGMANQDFDASEKIWEFFDLYEPPSSTIELNETTIQLYPNPTNGPVKLEGADEVESLELFDMSGRMIGNLRVQEELNVRFLNSGIYLLKIRTREGQLSQQKLIVH